MTYLAARGLPDLAASDALRFLPACWHRSQRANLPAMLALVVDGHNRPLAIHRTYLCRDGSSKAPVDTPRASLGPVEGGAVRLNPATDELVIGEGIETSASAGRLLGLPAWSAISAGNLARHVVLPPEVRRVIIAADPDEPGRHAMWAAWRRWRNEGRRVEVAMPAGTADFNDLLLEKPHAA